MKKYIGCAAGVLILTAASAGFAQETQTANAPYGVPVIDGAEDAAWDKASWYPIERYLTEVHGASGQFKVMWDEGHIYVLAQIKDEKLSKAAEAAYLQDSVEIFIDENNAQKSYYEWDDAQYRVNFDNETSFGDTAYAEEFRSAAKTTDGGYIIEAALPIKSALAEAGSTIGFDIQINDDTDGNGTRSVTKFSDTTDISYCNTSNFGKVTLEDAESPSFTDIENIGRDSEKKLARLVKRGVIQGCGDGTLRPDREISQEEREIIAKRLDNAVTAAEGKTRIEYIGAVYDKYAEYLTSRLKEDNRVKSDYYPELIAAADMKDELTANPIMTQRYGADPFAMEYDGRVYVYMSGETPKYDAEGNLLDDDYALISSVSVVSSADLVNWTDHGEIIVGGQAYRDGATKWAKNSWAPCAAHKTIDGKEKFFLYFADNSSGIGVLESDSPTGPFRDPLDAPLISRSTPGTEGVVWMFDPAVLVDDDGQAYLYFGGGIPSNNGVEETDHPKTARVIKLGADMISTEGEAVEIDAPAMFEDSGIHKYNGTYYYSYCTNFGGEHENGKYPYGVITYMTGKSPMGPFEYQGTALDNMYAFFEVGGNNHHSIFEFKGSWYIAYHAATVDKFLGAGRGYRSPHINAISHNRDGSIVPAIADYKGVEPAGSVDAYALNEAETIACMRGITTVRLGETNMQIRDINDGDSLTVRNVSFGVGAKGFKVKADSVSGGSMEIREKNADGKLLGTVEINGENREYECAVSGISGTKDICFVFKGEADKELFRLDSWQFVK